MEILKGTVEEAGYPPVPDVYYGKVDEKTIYYFIPNGKMENGNIIVSTNLKEAIGHAPHTSLGYIDPNGTLLIPCENKTLKQVGNKEDNILLAEKNTPTSESVLAIIKSMNNPANQQAIETNGKSIKDQMIQAMGMSGDFIFDNQCSEAALYTMDGLNVSNGYYSFISELNSNYYFATNVPGQQILTFNPSMLKQQGGEEQQAEQEAMPNIDIPIQQQVQNEEVANQHGVDMPPQVEPEATGQVAESTDQVNAENISNEQAEERLDQIMGFQNNNDGDSQEGSASGEEIAAEAESDDDEIDAESGEEMAAEAESDDDEIDAESGEEKAAEAESDDDEIEDEAEEEMTVEAESDDDEIEAEAEEEIAAEAESDDDEIEAEAEEEMTAEAESDDDEIEAEAEEEEIAAEAETEGAETKIESEEEKAQIIDFPKIYKLDDEAIATPVIRDATQTIMNIVEKNRELGRLLDEARSREDILGSNLRILNEDVRAKDEETRALRQELAKEREEKALYKSQAAEGNRRVIKLSAALERQIDITKDKDRQIEELSRQVAGLSNLNNAVMEANALVQPIDNSNEDNMIYGDFTYLGNAKSKGKVA